MKTKNIVLILTILLVVVILGVFFGLEKREVRAPTVKNNEKIKETTKTATSTKETENSEIDTSNWKTYRNEEFGFEVRYPEEWGVISNQKSNNELRVYLGYEDKYGSHGYEGEMYIFVYTDKSNNFLENQIKNIGKQYGDQRVEVRDRIIIDKLPATKVIITSNKNKDFYVDMIYLKKSRYIYVINNFYKTNTKISEIYKTFKLLR